MTVDVANVVALVVAEALFALSGFNVGSAHRALRAAKRWHESARRFEQSAKDWEAAAAEFKAAGLRYFEDGQKILREWEEKSGARIPGLNREPPAPPERH